MAEARALGTFCWVELATSDLSRSRAFYAAALGWECRDARSKDWETYTTWLADGDRVGGAHALSERQRAGGVTPEWIPYVHVSSASAAAKNAESLGGRLRHGPYEIGDLGKAAICEDAAGARFGVWAPIKTGTLVHPSRETGSFGWVELTAEDVDASARYYRQMFGWTHEERSLGGALPYGMLLRAGVPLGGIVAASGSALRGFRVYFSVANCDTAAGKADIEGGRVRVQPTDIPGVGRYAYLEDPLGACFCVLEWEKRGAG